MFCRIYMGAPQCLPRCINILQRRPLKFDSWTRSTRAEFQGGECADCLLDASGCAPNPNLDCANLRASCEPSRLPIRRTTLSHSAGSPNSRTASRAYVLPA